MDNLKGKVEAIIEFEGYDTIWYMTRGHVSAEAFQAEVQRRFNHSIETADVKQGYARNVPVGSDRPGEMLIHLAKGAGCGAYPITYFDHF